MGENEKQGKSQKKRLVVILIMLIVFIVLAIVFVSCRSVSKDRKKDSENSSEESILEDDVSAEESLEAVNSQEGNVTSSEKESDVLETTQHQHTWVSQYITVHHDAIYETQWIVDKAAYDEKVLTGYTCTCGVTKSN